METTSIADNVAVAQKSNETAGKTGYQYPSQRCAADKLMENHKNNVRFPEEIALDGFTFTAKVKPPMEGNPIHTTYFTHKDMPLTDEKTEEILGMHVILPQMYVQYLGNKIDTVNGNERGWKIILQPSSNGDSAYWKEGNDHYNLVQFLEGLDEKVVEAGFQHRKAWFPQEEQVESKADIKKLYKSPLAAYGAVENFKEPKYSNSWVDDQGQVITNYREYTGRKHRKYAPKIYLGLPFDGHKDVKTGADGKARTTYVKSNQLQTLFFDGWTRKQMDISTEDLSSWYLANKDGLQAEVIATLKCVQIDKLKLKVIANRIMFYTKSGRPSLSTRPLPSGIGFSTAAPSTSPLNDDHPEPAIKKEIAKEENVKEVAEEVAKKDQDDVKEVAKEDVPEKENEAASKDETNIESQKAYLASMKKSEEAASVTAPPFKESPRKKIKVSHAK